MDLQYQYLKTLEGHTLCVFYNAETRLLVVDVVDRDEAGGNEIVRRTLDFDALLGHCEQGEE